MYPYDTQPTQTVIPNRYGGIAYRPIPNQTGAGPIGVDQAGNNILPDWVNMQRAGYAQGQANRYRDRGYYGTPTRFLPEAEGGMRMIRSTDPEPEMAGPPNYMETWNWLKALPSTMSAPMAQNAAAAALVNANLGNRYAQDTRLEGSLPPLPVRPMTLPNMQDASGFTDQWNRANSLRQAMRLNFAMQRSNQQYPEAVYPSGAFNY